MSTDQPQLAGLEEPAAPDRVAEILDELGADDAVQLSKWDPSRNAYAFLGRIDGFENVLELQEMVAARYPEGGKFKVQRHGPLGPGKKSGYKGKAGLFTIAPRSTQITAVDPDAPPSLEDRLDRLERLLERNAAPAAAPPIDMAAMLQFGAQIAQMQAPILTAMLERERVDAMTLLEVYRDGRAERETNPQDDRLGTLIEAAIGAIARGQKPPPLPNAQPAGIPAPELPVYVQTLKPALPALFDAAAAGASPEDVATQIHGYLELETLKTALADPRLVDDLVAAHPPLGRYRTYVGDVVAALMDIVDPEPEELEQGDESE